MGRRYSSQRPEPANGWIERTFRNAWDPGFISLDLAKRAFLVGRGEGGSKLHSLSEETPEGRFYIPAVNPELRSHRNQTEEELNDRGVMTLCQRAPDERQSPFPTVVDLSALVLDPRASKPSALPGSWALWPLVPGVRNQPEEWTEWACRLAELGVEILQPIALDPPPKIRRALVDAWGEDYFEPIFHGEPHSERAFSAVVASWGLRPFAPRPSQAKRAGDGALVEALLLAAEYAHRLDDGATRVQGFLRAARWTEESKYEVSALVRDHQIRAIPWVEEESRTLMEEWVQAGESEILKELEGRYLKRPIATLNQDS